MSYAEHGPRIFLTGRFDPNPLSKYGDYILPKKRSEARLKLFGSCTDLRAWSPNPLDNCRYFREIVENPLPQGKVVPYDVMIETLISLGAQTQNELVSLRKRLNKYESLRLSTEQKIQLRKINDYPVKNRDDEEDEESFRPSKSSEDEDNGVPERPGTPEHSMCCPFSNFDIETADQQREIDNERYSEYRYDDVKRVASSKTDSSEYVDPSEGNRFIMDEESHQAIIIEKDSEIIALKNKLAAKDVELDELKDFDRNLEIILKDKEAALDNLRRNLNISQQQIEQLRDQLHQGMEESDKQLYNSECLIDRLKTSLAEKSNKCNDCSREIEELRRQIKDAEMIRNERDCLIRTLENMSDERNALRELNQQQAMDLADQDDEMNRLLGLLKLKAAECGEREMRMKRTIDELRTDIRIMKNEMHRLEADRRASTWKQLTDDGDLRKMANLEIRKMKCALIDDLREIEEEICRRTVVSPQNRCLVTGETTSRTARKCDKDLAEYTNEQLKTMQVSGSVAENDQSKDDEIYERIVSRASGSLEKMQRLIVELEPYRRERSTLIEHINRLNESLEESENRAEESRDVDDETQCGDPIESLVPSETTREIMDSGKDNGDLGEGSNREEIVYRLNEEKLDEKIDEALVIQVKRSIERVEKISMSLEGAGDCISREMAKKEKEIESRNEEIARLRLQVSSRASRGQGDHAGQEEHLNEIIRVKNELSTTQRSLQRTRDQLQSSDFKLKGANQRIKNLGVEIDRLVKENKGLNKTVLITNDFAIKVDEMQLRLDSSQEENSRLLKRITRTNEICADYQNKLIDVKEEGLRAKDAFERAETKMQSMLLGRDNVIETLREDRNTLKRELEETENRSATLTEQIKSLRLQNKNVDFLEALIKEILKVDKNAKRLRGNLDSMKIQLENQRRNNDEIEENLNVKLRENETLESDTKQLCLLIERHSRDDAMAEAMVEQVLDNLPNKVLSDIGALKVRLGSSATVDLPFQIEMNKLETKSREDASVIENLRRDVVSLNKKAAEQEKAIVSLEEANADLKRQMEDILKDREQAEQELPPEISNEELIDGAKILENEIKEKNEKIEDLVRENAATQRECMSLNEKLQSLTNAQTKLSEEMESEKASWELKMINLQQQYKHRERALHDQHNVSVKRLEAQYEEDFRNNRNPFDPETWLRSLTINEMTELHKRVCKSTPCHASQITRALNDKQNQQLQDDEKLLHSDIIKMKTDRHKETAIAYPGYIYERRKFEKPAETPVNDNTMFDMQGFNFINQCAMERYDSSN